MPNINLISPTCLPRELTALTGEQSPPYRKLWTLIVDGRLPAEQVNGRWYVNRTDLPKIAADLGMVQPKAAAKLNRARRAAVEHAPAL